MDGSAWKSLSEDGNKQSTQGMPYKSGVGMVYEQNWTWF